MKDEEIELNTAILAWEKGFPKKLGKITQSLLQRWLREKHQINISMISGSNTINLWYFEINIAHKYPIKSDGSKNFKYEEALEDALIKALNLIKIK